MANKTQERLLNLFSQASGGARVNDSAAPAASSAQRGDPSSAFAKDASSFDPSTESGAGQSFPGTSGSSSANTTPAGSGNTLESVATSVFGGALGLIPLAGAIYGLFDSSSPQPQVFQKYEKPSSISFEAADTGSGLVSSGYDQMGLPRLYDSSEGASAAGTDAPASSPAASTSSTAAQSSGAPSATPQISVNVQAMDAQSFMSYSGEIAKAVRDAMLNLSSINDVVSEL